VTGRYSSAQATGTDPDGTASLDPDAPVGAEVAGTASDGTTDVPQDGAPSDEAVGEPDLGATDDKADEVMTQARRTAAWESGPLSLPPSGPTLSFGFNLHKVPGQGEDSDPIVREGRELGLIGVFDGMGGAGGTVYETPDGPRTGAYLASRVARDVVEARMLALLDPEWNLDGPAAAEDLRRNVARALAAALEGLDAPKSGLRSRLLRALPTTMAVMALQRREARTGRWAAHVFWSGDSRVYVLTPRTGAHQLTRDDIRDQGDALTNLRQDSVVSNAMSADTDFVVHHHQVELAAPFLAVAATDGCFGYVRTPLHFEHLLLAALVQTSSTQEWSALLAQRIGEISGDDAAMAVLGVGADHEEFRRLFSPRAAQLDERAVVPLDHAEADVGRAEAAVADARRRQAHLQTSLWSDYKAGYERYLAPKEDA
jgi:hypothetical protein